MPSEKIDTFTKLSFISNKDNRKLTVKKPSRSCLTCVKTALLFRVFYLLQYKYRVTFLSSHYQYSKTIINNSQNHQSLRHKTVQFLHSNSRSKKPNADMRKLVRLATQKPRTVSQYAAKRPSFFTRIQGVRGLTPTCTSLHDLPGKTHELFCSVTVPIRLDSHGSVPRFKPKFSEPSILQLLKLRS